MRHPRRIFLSRTARLGALAMAGAAVASASDAAQGVSLRPKGLKTSKVARWVVITLGDLSRNRYWGESDAKPTRTGSICTCTLVQGEGFCLIADPSLSDAAGMARELDRRTGLGLRDVTAAFVTHEHGDHWYGLAHFPDARWLAAPDVAAALNKTGRLPKPVEAVTGRLFESVDVLPTPGHTLGHHSLRFDWNGYSVVVAGDAVATRDFWRERRGYYNCVDFELSAKSMDRIAAVADLVVPGHDNYFLNVDA
jgi:glyoxylase-like metal-dependent hydrolase (beta-lactamase superfamily II)